MRVLDTDTCIEILRGNQAVVDRRAQVRDLVVTTWITACELYFGAARSMKPDENRALVARFLETLPILGLGRAAARVFGDVKAALRAEGAIVADADLLIGAIAAARGAIIVTGNQRHYGRIPGLATEDWIRGSTARR